MERESGDNVLPEADHLEHCARHEEVHLPGEAVQGVELGQHLTAAGTVARMEEVVTGFGVPACSYKKLFATLFLDVNIYPIDLLAFQKL